jgi:ATP-dependent exoDNAse (exonuclease V) alpha subunit
MIPFGGVQMVLIGDLFQLPPVVTESEQSLFEDIYASPYFFDSKIYRELNNGENHPQRVETIELKKIYRQKEEDFVRLLGAIRDRTATAEHLKVLNQRFIPQFQPDQSDRYIYLTTTNVMADRINRARLEALPADSYSYAGIITGDFESKTLPTQQILELKVSAQVMLLNNDPGGRWRNGSIGKILEFIDHGKIVVVELADGSLVEVAQFKWEMFRFYYNEDTETLESQPVGSFTQYPLRLAWAVTIHKSQGKTFTHVIIDVGNGTFAHGQIYVALSRCTSFEGIILKKPILYRHILLDDNVTAFMASQMSNARQPLASCPECWDL